MNKKKLIMSLICLLLAGYVLFAGRLYSDKRDRVLCQDLNIQIEDSVAHPYIRASEIRQLLLVNRVAIKGTPVKDLDMEAIEHLVETHSLVKNAECFVSPAGYVCIQVRQRVPILRVISGGEKFFVDEEGRQMNIPVLAAVNVPVATGAINRNDTLLMKNLYEMALFLRENEFWDAMIEQLVVKQNADWMLYPRVGNFEILLGKPVNLEYKMQSLRCFYEDALPKVGWDRYSRINLEYDHQIIGTKK